MLGCRAVAFPSTDVNSKYIFNWNEITLCHNLLENFYSVAIIYDILSD